MKKTAIKSEAITFNVTYADIAAGAKLIREQLKQNISFVKKLAKRAQKLYDYGNKKCYIEDNKNGIHPIDGIKNLGDKMDLLEQMMFIDEALESFAEEFDLEVK